MGEGRFGGGGEFFGGSERTISPVSGLNHANPEIGYFESGPEIYPELYRGEPTEAQARFLILVSNVYHARYAQSMVERQDARRKALDSAREMNHLLVDDGVVAMGQRLLEKRPDLAFGVARVLVQARTQEAFDLINIVRQSDAADKRR